MSFSASRMCSRKMRSSFTTERLRRGCAVQVGTEAAVGQYVDTSSEQLFKILLERDHIEQSPARLHIDQQIEVAARVCVGAGDRTEDAHIPLMNGNGKARNRHVEIVVPVSC